MTDKIIIHLSDLHIGDCMENAHNTWRVFDAIAQNYAGCPVLITGDIVDSGDEGQMIKTRDLIDTLAESNPVVVVPGNHDYAWHGIHCNDNAAAAWHRHLPPAMWMNYSSSKYRQICDGLFAAEHDGLVIFGIDSGDPTDKVHTARGYISEGLTEELRRELTARKGKTRIVMLHHHPFDHGTFTRLVGAERFTRAVESNCEILLFGHEHRFGIWRNRNGIPLTVASHKTTSNAIGGHLLISVIQVTGDGNFWHRLEVV